MTTPATRYVLVSAVLCMASPARAEDPADTADTISSLWTGAALRLAEDEKRFVLAVTQVRDGLRVRGEVSAPLDGDTRTAAFVGKNGLAPGFRGDLYLGYDSTFRALALDASDRTLLAYCERKHIDPCLQSKVDEDMRHEGQPAARQETLWGVGIAASYAYDSKTAFVDDVAADTADFRVTDLQVDLSAVVTLPTRWALSVRAGYERANRVTLADFTRCMSLPSTDMSVSGTSCSDAQYLVRDPAPESSGHVRLAAAYYPIGPRLARYLAATEARVNVENLATDSASLDFHVLGFLAGLPVGTATARIGLGATVRTALTSPDGADYVAGDIYDYSVFGVVGTSF